YYCDGCSVLYFIFLFFFFFFFFFQAEDGIRDFHVTGVQTCALPISDQVGQRVVLHAELALGVGQPRDPAVDAVEDRRHEDRHAGRAKAPLGRRDDREESREQAPGGKQVRQQVDATRARGRRGCVLVIHGGSLPAAARIRRCGPQTATARLAPPAGGWCNPLSPNSTGASACAFRSSVPPWCWPHPPWAPAPARSTSGPTPTASPTIPKLRRQPARRTRPGASPMPAPAPRPRRPRPWPRRMKTPSAPPPAPISSSCSATARCTRTMAAATPAN